MGPIRQAHFSHIDIRASVPIEIGNLQRVRVGQPIVQHLGLPQVLGVRARSEQRKAAVQLSDIGADLANGDLRPAVAVYVRQQQVVGAVPSRRCLSCRTSGAVPDCASR